MDHLGCNILAQVQHQANHACTQEQGNHRGKGYSILNTTRRLVSALPHHFIYCLVFSFKQKSTKRPATSLSSNSIFLAQKENPSIKIGK